MSVGCPDKTLHRSAEVRRAPQQREKVEQAGIIKLCRSLGGRVYVLGTRRRRGDFQGTMQTPGIPDLFVFMPQPRGEGAPPWHQVWIECKAEGGRLSEAQKEFQALCVGAGGWHIVGGINAVIAQFIKAGWLRADQVAHYRLPKLVSSHTVGAPKC
jgi:hypothetical protein